MVVWDMIEDPARSKWDFGSPAFNEENVRQALGGEADVAGRARADREYFGGRLAYRVFSRRGALATDKLAFYAFLNREGFRLARDARHDALARGARPAPRVELVPRGVDRSASSARSRRRAAGRREPTRRVT